MFSRIFAVFLVFSLFDLSHAKLLPAIRESKLVTSELEEKVEDLLEEVRNNNAALAEAKKDNDKVLSLTEKLLEETKVAQVAELTNTLQKEYGIRGYVTNVDLYHQSGHEKIVVKALDYFIPKLETVQQDYYQEIPALNGVEASPNLGNRPAKIVSNELFDSEQSVKSILEKLHAKSLAKLDTSLGTVRESRHEQLISRLDVLAKRYADGLGEKVQLIPLVSLEHSTEEGRYYQDFLVVLIHEIPISLGSTELNFPQALASIAIRLLDKDLESN